LETKNFILLLSISNGGFGRLNLADPLFRTSTGKSYYKNIKGEKSGIPDSISKTIGLAKKDSGDSSVFDEITFPSTDSSLSNEELYIRKVENAHILIEKLENLNILYVYRDGSGNILYDKHIYTLLLHEVQRELQEKYLLE
jgi:hypothetical protein